MKRPEHQSGFSTVEILLIVLVIGIFGAAGWFVYQHNRTKVSDAAPNGTPSTNQQTTTTTPAPTVAYLTIKEWGVKLPLSDSIKDAYYVVNSSSPDINNPDSILLSLKSLDSSGCAADNSNHGQSGALALIGRVAPTDTDPVSGVRYTKLYPNGTTIGNYYYFFQDRTKQLTCASQTSLQNISSALATATKATISATAN